MTASSAVFGYSYSMTIWNQKSALELPWLRVHQQLELAYPVNIKTIQTEVIHQLNRSLHKGLVHEHIHKQRGMLSMDICTKWAVLTRSKEYILVLTARFCGQAATPAKLVDQVHPPILSDTFKWRCAFFKSPSRLKLPYRLFPVSFQESSS